MATIITRNVTLYFRWSTGVVSAPALTISAVNFLRISLILPKKPSSPVVLGLPSHSSSCLLSAGSDHVRDETKWRRRRG